jgi:multiple sugar transport system substrate-binding protein
MSEDVEGGRSARSRVQGELTRRSLMGFGGLILVGAALAPSLAACGSSGESSKKITIWWNSGFYPEENRAVQAIASAWEKQSGKTVDLQFYSTDDLPTKEQAAVSSGVLPDIVEAENGTTATYAYHGQLADVSDVVKSADFTDGAKRSVNLYNSNAGKAGYYAVPIDQFTVPLFYWKNLLSEAGANHSSLPTNWDGFWNVFSDAQGSYRKKTGKQIYAAGWPMSTSAGDTTYDTQMIMLAFGAELLNSDGGLNADDPQVKANMIKALTWIADLYKNGLTPKDCLNWGDDDNNTAFLSKSVLITPNGSLSIPGAVKGKNTQDWANIVTSPFPDKADGSGPTPALAQVHNAVVFQGSPNKEAAMDFLKFFVRPENTLKFLKGGKGRWHPVQQSLLSNAYYADSDDPNIRSATQMLAGSTVPAWLNASVAYSQAALNGLWGNTLGQIVLQGQSPSAAADYAISQLKQAYSTFPTK